MSRLISVASRGCRRLRYRIDMVLSPGAMSVSCPCCGYRFRSFVAGHYQERSERYNPVRYAGIGQDVICPVCGSLPRHRILAAWCDDHVEALRQSEILYFAPERSIMLWMKRHGVRCMTADLHEEADLVLDIQATGLADESYDVVFSNHVLEHVDDFRVALREMLRILKQGGMFVCSFPMDPQVDVVDEGDAALSAEERYRRYGQVDHLRVFGMRADLLLEEAGFAVEVINGADCPDEIVPVVGPADYDANRLFCCVK